jgi:predicted O-methyltransferase YrrM
MIEIIGEWSPHFFYRAVYNWIQKYTVLMLRKIDKSIRGNTVYELVPTQILFSPSRDVLLYLVVGKDEFWEIRRRFGHTCSNGVSDLPFSAHVTKLTDIHEHLVSLFMLTVELKLRTVVELGTRGGESTVALLFAAKETGGRVFSLDIDECLDAKKVILEYGLSDYWRFLQTDDLNVDWKMPIDHLFIDTTHTYEQTINELRKFEPFVRRGGIVTIHDSVSSPDVRRAALDFVRGRSELKKYEYLNNNGLIVIFKHALTNLSPTSDRCLRDLCDKTWLSGKTRANTFQALINTEVSMQDKTPFRHIRSSVRFTQRVPILLETADSTENRCFESFLHGFDHESPR